MSNHNVPLRIFSLLHFLHSSIIQYCTNIQSFVLMPSTSPADSSQYSGGKYVLPSLKVQNTRFTHSESVSLPCSVDGEAHVGTCQSKTEEHEFHEEPCPAATRLLPSHRGGLLRSVGSDWTLAAWIFLVEIQRLDIDDVVVVGKFTSLGREA